MHLRGSTKIGAGARIDTGTVLTDVVVHERAVLKPYTIGEKSVIGSLAQIGPFSHLRAGSELAEDTHIGNFVETKKTRVGKGSKANHLAYLGDGVIGEGVNVGAGTIFCNYDGYAKHVTTLEDGVFIGSDSQLVAPVTVGKKRERCGRHHGDDGRARRRARDQPHQTEQQRRRGGQAPRADEGQQSRLGEQDMRTAMLVLVLSGCALSHEVPRDGGPFDASPSSAVLTTCSGSASAGPTRDCGWFAGGSAACVPGTIMRVGCNSMCGVGSCTGDSMIRVCDTGPCTNVQALGSNDDSCGTTCSMVDGFTCPASGQIFVLTGPFGPGSPYTCSFAVR